MADEQETLTLECNHCRQDKVIIAEELTDDSLITCDACGAEHGTWGSIKMELTQAIAELAKETFGKGLNDTKYVKYKTSIN
jgi:hypothetical protein